MSTLTATGQPRIGARIEVQTTDDEWIAAKIVAKGFGRGPDHHRVIAVVLEHEDEDGPFRSGLLPWGEPDGIVWRERRLG